MTATYNESTYCGKSSREDVSFEASSLNEFSVGKLLKLEVFVSGVGCFVFVLPQGGSGVNTTHRLKPR